MSGVLLAKLLLAPACVVGASLAGRRWGARVAGLIGGLPVVGGPILLVLALIHGREFGAASAGASLLGLVSLTAFALVYGRVAERHSWPVAVLSGWAAFLALTLAFSPFHVPRGVGLAAALAAFWLGPRLLPEPSAAGAAPPRPPVWDLPLRAAAAAALVLTISAVSGALGPRASGLLAPFPIITAVLAVFTHVLGGRAPLGTLLRGFLVGFNAYAAFCFVASVALGPLAIGPAFGLALLAALAVQGAVALGRR